jgi:hypothetical protein
MAFFLDISPETSKRGSYKLVVTSAGQNATKFLREAVDFVDPSTAARRSLDGGQPGLGAGSGMR